MIMKNYLKQFLSVLFVICMVIPMTVEMLPINASAAETIVTNASYQHVVPNDYKGSNLDYDKDTFSYRDSYFNQSSYDGFSYDITQFSFALAFAGLGTSQRGKEQSANLKGIFGKIGCSSSSYVSTFDETPGINTIGYFFASKDVTLNGKNYKMVFVVIRGGNYKTEWAGNFYVGSSGEHQGFATAANTVYTKLTDYIAQKCAGKDLKILICGYSRAGATTNLLAKRLDEAALNGSISHIVPENIFAYGFEVPMGAVNDVTTKYQGYTLTDNIFSIVNESDFVTKVAPAAYGFRRYGKTVYVPQNSTATENSDMCRYFSEYFSTKNPNGRLDVTYSIADNQSAVLENLFRRLTAVFKTRKDYTNRLQSMIMEIMGKKETTAGIDLKIVLHGIPGVTLSMNIPNDLENSSFVDNIGIYDKYKLYLMLRGAISITGIDIEAPYSKLELTKEESSAVLKCLDAVVVGICGQDRVSRYWNTLSSLPVVLGEAYARREEISAAIGGILKEVGDLVLPAIAQGHYPEVCSSWLKAYAHRWPTPSSGTGSSCNCNESYAGEYTCTASDYLVIHSDHSWDSATKIGSIPRGATCTVTKSDGRYAHVTYSGISGIAAMNYLKKKTTSDTTTCNCSASVTGLYYCTSSTNLVIHSDHSWSDATAIGRIPGGEVCLVTKKSPSSTYTHVVYKGVEGIASWNFLKPVDSWDVSVKLMPFKTVYELGEAFDPSGLSLEVSYSYSTSDGGAVGWMTVVDNYTLSGYDPTVLGEQEITVTYGGKTTSFPVFVTPVTIYVTGITTSQTLSMSISEKRTLAYTITPANATNQSITFSSNNPSVVSVDAAGVITALKVGSAVITVTTSDGGYTASCSISVYCNHNNSRTLEGREPTCTENGLTEGKVCTDCGAVLAAQSTVPALGHNYSYAITTTPTTSAAGTLTGTCTRCSNKTTVTLPKLDTANYNYSVTKAATCAATGTGRYTWKTTTYGSFYFDVTIAKTSHSYTSIVTAPTCTEQGYTTYTCSVCGNSYKNNYTAALGHNYVYTVSNGVRTGTCSRCGDVTREALAAKSLSIINLPAKTTYYVGEPLQTSGLTLKATYSDGSTATVTSGFATSGFSSSTTGTKTVTVTFGGKTATFTVKVIARQNGLVAENGGIRYYKNNETQIGWQTIGDKTVYFKPANGLMLTYSTATIDGVTYSFESYEYNGFNLNAVIKDGPFPESNGIKFYVDGVSVTGWQTVNGKTIYLLAKNSLMFTGTALKVNGITYEFESFIYKGMTLNTVVKTGLFLESDGYRFYKSGKMQTGWQTVGSRKVYFDPTTGLMATDTVSLDGTEYYLESFVYCGNTLYAAREGLAKEGSVIRFYKNGVRQTGWQTIDGKTLYFRPANAAMSTYSSLKINDVTYRFENVEYNGMTLNVMIKNGVFPEDGGIRFYVDGIAQTGWQTINGKTIYLLAKNSLMFTGTTLKVNGIAYQFESFIYMDMTLNTVVKTGLFLESDGYRFYKSGKMQTGWQIVGSRKVYFAPTMGLMATDTVSLNGVDYYLESFVYCGNTLYAAREGLVKEGSVIRFYKNGVRQTGWQTVDGKTLYFRPVNAAMSTYSSLKINGVTYHFKNVDCNGLTLNVVIKDGAFPEDGGIRFYANGVVQTGWETVNGKQVYFSPTTGLMLTYSAAKIDGVTYHFESYVYNGMTLNVKVD